jgi:FMN phosphatase YigB (HAD superfamily)
MTLTLLIDLDGTLLTNPIDSFLEQYFKELSAALAPYVRPEIMMTAMGSAVRAMLTKKDPAGSLEEIFSEKFFPAIGVPRSDLVEILTEFYQVQFPKLASLTAPRPAAVEIMNKAFQRGWQVVVATNPLFPATAIHQRLNWAGLPPQQFPFAWIADYETSHFCKPNPSYYAELLAFLRWPEMPVVMVGDDWESDILPAEILGIPTYWLCENEPENPVHPRHPASSQGSFDRLDLWLLSIENGHILPRFDTIPALKAALTVTPATLAAFAAQVDYRKWNLRPLKEEWSLTEILCHLRDVDREVNLPRIHSIMNGSNPFIPGAVTDPWVDERNYAQECGPDALTTFTQIRTEILHLLESLGEDEWQNPARHAIFGPTTLHELIHFIATHDRSHIQQFWQTARLISDLLDIGQH